MKNYWFPIALVSMFSFSAMALTLKKLTYVLPTSVILFYMFAMVSVMYLGTNLIRGNSLNPGLSPLLLLLVATAFAFLGNLCDVEALRLAPNAGYAAAVKAGQILIITAAALFLFKDQHISWQGAAGVLMIFGGITLLAFQR